MIFSDSDHRCFYKNGSKDIQEKKSSQFQNSVNIIAAGTFISSVLTGIKLFLIFILRKEPIAITRRHAINKYQFAYKAELGGDKLFRLRRTC